jgi:hypothetical protein
MSIYRQEASYQIKKERISLIIITDVVDYIGQMNNTKVVRMSVVMSE